MRASVCCGAGAVCGAFAAFVALVFFGDPIRHFGARIGSIWAPDHPIRGVSAIVGGALLGALVALPAIRLRAPRQVVDATLRGWRGRRRAVAALVLTGAMAVALAPACALLWPTLLAVREAQPVQLDLGTGVVVGNVLLLCWLAACALLLLAGRHPRRGRRLGAAIVAAPGACVLVVLATLVPAVVLFERAERLEARGRRRHDEAWAAWKAGDAAHARARWQRGCDAFAEAARSYERVAPVYGSQDWADLLAHWSRQAPGWPDHWR